MSDPRAFATVVTGEFDFGPEDDGATLNATAARERLAERLNAVGARMHGTVPELTPEQSREELASIRRWMAKRFQELRSRRQ